MESVAPVVDEPSRPQARRRVRIINPAFQWKYTAVIIVAVFFLCTMLGTVLYGVLFQQARARLIDPTSSNPWENTMVLMGASGAFAVVVAAALGIWSVIMTHRICGPIYVMEGYLTSLAQGRFPRRRPLRKKDEFKEFYDLFWRAIEAMKDQRQNELHRLSEVLKALQAVGDPASPNRGIELELMTHQITALRKEIAETLGKEAVDSGGWAASPPARAKAPAAPGAPAAPSAPASAPPASARPASAPPASAAR